MQSTRYQIKEIIFKKGRAWIPNPSKSKKLIRHLWKCTYFKLNFFGGICTEISATFTMSGLSTLSFFFLAAVISLARGQIQTPDVTGDEQGLYLTTAGLNSRIIRPLSSRETICLKDYPTGISVLCAGNAPYATFYVNNVFAIRERKAPFYIRGDVHNRVRAWNPSTGVNWVKCRLRTHQVFVSRIYFKKC